MESYCLADRVDREIAILTPNPAEQAAAGADDVPASTATPNSREAIRGRTGWVSGTESREVFSQACNFVMIHSCKVCGGVGRKGKKREEKVGEEKGSKGKQKFINVERVGVA